MPCIEVTVSERKVAFTFGDPFIITCARAFFCWRVRRCNTSGFSTGWCETSPSQYNVYSYIHPMCMCMWMYIVVCLATYIHDTVQAMSDPNSRYANVRCMFYKAKSVDAVQKNWAPVVLNMYQWREGYGSWRRAGKKFELCYILHKNFKTAYFLL